MEHFSNYSFAFFMEPYGCFLSHLIHRSLSVLLSLPYLSPISLSHFGSNSALFCSLTCNPFIHSFIHLLRGSITFLLFCYLSLISYHCCIKKKEKKKNLRLHLSLLPPFLHFPLFSFFFFFYK